jgi:hypothetical protein
MSRQNKEGYPKKKGTGNDAEDILPKVNENTLALSTQEEENPEKALIALENAEEEIVHNGTVALEKGEKLGGSKETVNKFKKELASIGTKAKNIFTSTKQKIKDLSPKPKKGKEKIEKTEEDLQKWRKATEKNIINEINKQNELREKEGKSPLTTEEKYKIVLDKFIDARDIYNGKKKESSGVRKIVKDCLKKGEEWWLDTNKHKVAKAGLNALLTVAGTWATGYLDKGILAKAGWRAVSAVATTGIITSESGQKKIAEILKFGNKLNEYVNNMFKDAGLNEKQEKIARMITKGGFIVLGAGTIVSGLVATGVASGSTLAISAIGAGVRYGITKGKDYVIKEADKMNKELYEKLGNDFDITKFEKTSDKEVEDIIKEIKKNNAIKRILNWEASALGLSTSVATADLLLLSMQNNTDALHNPSKTETTTPAPAPTTSDSLTANQKYENFLNNKLETKKDSLVSDAIPDSDKSKGAEINQDTISSSLNNPGDEENIPDETKENQEQSVNKPTDVEKKNVNVKRGGIRGDETKETKAPVVAEKPKLQSLEDAKKIGLNENAIIHKGEGVTDAFAKQLKADPELAKKLGFTDNLDDKHDLARFTKQLAMDTGYIDEKGNEIRVLGVNKTAYVLGIDANDKPTVSENEWSKMPNGTHGWMGTEDHTNGTIFEGKKHDTYEYIDDKNKPSGEHKTDQGGPVRASENSGPTYRTNILDDSEPSPAKTEMPSPAPTLEVNSGLDKYTYDNINKSPIWGTLTNENAHAFLIRNPSVYTPEEEKIRHLLRTELTKARNLENDLTAYLEKHKDIKIYEILTLAHNISDNGYTIDDQGVLYSPEEMKDHIDLIIKQGNVYHNTLEEIFQKKGGFFSRGGMDQKLWDKTGNENMLNLMNKGQFAKELKAPQEDLLRVIKTMQDKLSMYDDKPVPRNDETVKSYFKRLVDFAVVDNKVNVRNVVEQVQKEAQQIPTKQR